MSSHYFFRLIVLVVSLTACVHTPDQLYQTRLVAQKIPPDANQVAQLDRLLLQSERFADRILKANTLLDNATKAAQAGQPCAQYMPLIEQALQQHHTSLVAHKMAIDCAKSMANTALANAHEKQFSLLLDRMRKNGNGEDAFHAIQVFNLRDVDAYLAHAQLRQLSAYFDLTTVYRQTQLVVVANTEQGKQQTLHFDLQTFFENYLRRPNTEPATYVIEGIRALADSGDSAAMIGIADYLIRFGDEDVKATAIDFLEKASAQNNASAQLRLHWRFAQGKYTAVDNDRALLELTKAVEAGHAAAEVRMAQLYDAGLLVKKDPAIRDALLKRAEARIGVADARAQLAFIYLTEKPSPEDHKALVHWLSKAAETGDPDAVSALASVYRDGVSVTADKKKAFALYQQAADLGLPSAQTQLALFYLSGDSVEKNPSLALDWLNKASKRDAAANFLLAAFYEEGYLVEKNVARAEYLTAEAARRGSSKAMCHYATQLRNKKPMDWPTVELWYLRGLNAGAPFCAVGLGSAYLFGFGPAKNPQQAIYWLTVAADNQQTNAFAMLGMMYELGMGVAKDPNKAVEYYEKGVKLNHVGAMFLLGQLYADGAGVARNDAKALPLFQKAAEEGHDDAQLYLARFYRDGRGLPADRNEAVKWFSLAAKAGNKKAQNELRLLGVDFTKL